MSDSTVLLLDQNDHLRLYGYYSCTNDDPIEKKQSRGLITDLDDQVIFRSLPYTDEFIADDPVIPDLNLEEWDVYPSIEGTLLRMFCHQKKWYLSTNKKLDAFQSFWSSETSFGEKFYNTILSQNIDIGAFEASLNPSLIHIFLLSTTQDNRIVCRPQPDVPRIVWVCSLDKDGRSQPNPLLETMFPKPAKLSISTVPRLIEETQELDPYRYQGLILFHQRENRQIKILNPVYSRLSKIRNNCPNLLLRYLQVRIDPEKKKDFLDLYPEGGEYFDSYEKHIERIVQKIHASYVSKFIRHVNVLLPRHEYQILKECHDHYHKDRINNKIYPETVKQIVDTMEPRFLFRVLRDIY
jgi:hypothetical protein